MYKIEPLNVEESERPIFWYNGVPFVITSISVEWYSCAEPTTLSMEAVEISGQDIEKMRKEKT